jgi:hypothetical protein
MTPRVTIGSVTLAKRHARATDEHGQVIPRCNAYRGSDARENMIVTGNPARVTCEACRKALS